MNTRIVRGVITFYCLLTKALMFNASAYCKWGTIQWQSSDEMLWVGTNYSGIKGSECIYVKTANGVTYALVEAVQDLLLEVARASVCACVCGLNQKCGRSVTMWAFFNHDILQEGCAYVCVYMCVCVFVHLKLSLSCEIKTSKLGKQVEASNT